ncbi:hypothetical protein CKO_01063 [Citrobacter koseri ATCC BAA-895]|uniref:Uncharacterized protein n=1 Tax=Citrobacter koseri (strain ATCC BAA-895 / CDC 4225-83 / SGSC4696) TaxID=290338 RepID=A8AFE3_CITK8|nr:hypothetical protein CKO_01063 [Citrobacter koseri ATCC BAA-895]
MTLRLSGLRVRRALFVPDGALLIRPTHDSSLYVGRIRCLHRHPANTLPH